MDKFIIEHDVDVYCVTATSFPKGIVQAHEILRRLAPMRNDRNVWCMVRIANQ